VTPESLIVAVLILGFSLIVVAVAIGSAIGDGIVASKAVEAIARQPEARGNIFTFFFLEPTSFEGPEFTLLTLMFFLFFERLCIMLFALNVEFDQGGVFGTVRGNTCLGLWKIDYID